MLATWNSNLFLSWTAKQVTSWGHQSKILIKNMNFPGINACSRNCSWATSKHNICKPVTKTSEKMISLAELSLCVCWVGHFITLSLILLTFYVSPHNIIIIIFTIHWSSIFPINAVLYCVSCLTAVWKLHIDNLQKYIHL